MKLNSKLRLFLIRSASLGLLTSAASAVEIQKDAVANTNNLNTGAAWVGGTAPGAADVAVWDNTVTATNLADSQTLTQLGGDVSWQGIKITDVGGTNPQNGTNSNIQIRNTSSANTLTLGSAGIDMSLAEKALLIQSKITLAADQEWNVRNASNTGSPFGFNNGEDLGLSALVANNAFNLGGFALTLKGLGNITITSGWLISNGTINVQNNTKIQGGGTRTTSLSNTVDVNITAGGLLHFQANNNAPVTNNAAISVSGAGSTLNFGLGDNALNSSTGDISMATGTTLQILGNNGAFTQSGGVDFTGDVNWNYTGSGANSNGAVVSGNLTGDGSVNYSNANSNANGQVRLSGDNSGFTGTMTLNGASNNRALRLMTASSGSAAATWAVNANNILQVDGVSVQLGTLNGAGTVTNSHASNAATLNVGAGTFSGVISDGATATTSLVSTGTLTLDGTNTYAGGTTVSAGKLTIGTDGSINDTSGVTIGTASTAAAAEFNYNSSTALTQAVSFAAGSTGGTLSGTGTINMAVNVTAGNTLAIGNSVGAMAFGDNLEVGGTFLYELMGGGSTADLGDVAGNLTLGGILDLVQLGTYTLGDKFTLFAYDGALSGIFTGILDDTNFTDAGGMWTMNYNDTTAGLNGGVSASNTYVTITAIPEPRAALLGGLGMLMLLRRRRA